MNYHEAIDCDDITRAEALREIGRHMADPIQFFLDVGDKDQYTGAEVLAWLGY